MKNTQDKTSVRPALRWIDEMLMWFGDDRMETTGDDLYLAPTVLANHRSLYVQCICNEVLFHCTITGGCT